MKKVVNHAEKTFSDEWEKSPFMTIIGVVIGLLLGMAFIYMLLKFL